MGVLLSISLTAFFVRDLIALRLAVTGRLEALSVDERSASLRDGWQTFLSHPLTGIGPGAYNLVRQTWTPPHLTWLLAIAETGLFGLVAIGLFGISAIRFFRVRPNPTLYPLMATLLTLSFLDYYFWAFWSGKALFMIVFLFMVLPQHAALDTQGVNSAK